MGSKDKYLLICRQILRTPPITLRREECETNYVPNYEQWPFDDKNKQWKAALYASKILFWWNKQWKNLWETSHLHKDVHGDASCEPLSYLKVCILGILTINISAVIQNQNQCEGYQTHKVDKMRAKYQLNPLFSPFRE